MKSNCSKTFKSVLAGLGLGLCLAAYQGRAQYNQYWDDAGSSTPTSGNWDTTSSFWSTNTLSATPVPFTNNNFAVFAAGSTTISALTITVPGAITCEGIGDGTTWNSGGGQSGAYVTTLTFSGAGSINFPTGVWSIDCGASANTIVINVPLTGAGGIAQHNSGSLSLYGNNSYSGGTAETGGQIINYNNNNSFGTGLITNSGGNAIYLCTNNLAHLITIPNPWYLNIGASIWDFGDGNTTLTGPVYLYSTTQIKNNGGANTPLTISGAITNVGGTYGVWLECPNSSSIILSGSNTYAGQTIIGLVGATTAVTVSNINSVTTPAQQSSSSLGVPSSAANGWIQLGSTTGAGKLIYVGPGETSDRVINLSGTTAGATIEMDGAGPLILTAGISATTNGAKMLVLQGSSTAANAENGVIANSGNGPTTLAKGQAGSWTLGGLNTFTGGINVSNGTLTIGGSGDLGNSGGNGTYAGNITNSGTFVYNSSAAQSLSGIISGAGQLQQMASGNLTISGADTYTGATTVGGSSTLILSGTGKLANNTAITLNGILNVNSTAGQNVDLVAGSGTFNQNAVATSTLTNLNDTFSGLYNVTAGTISFNSDGCLGAAPGTFEANDITLNGGPAAGLRANANNISINANRGITLGANGGEIQVAGNDTCTYSGIISGSGVFQMGQNATTGLGVLVLGGSQPYTNYTVLAAGTLRLALGADVGNSAGIIMSNTATLDVSTQNMFGLSTTNTFTAIGSTNMTPTILGASGGSVSFGSQPVFLSFVPTLAAGDPTNEALIVSQSTLTLNGNVVDVTNASALPLGVGDYALVQCTNGITISSPLTLNYSGPIVANVSTNLVVIGNNTLALQIVPAAGYSGSQFTNQIPYPTLSVAYGTANATFSGTLIGSSPTYPNMGESVNIAIPNVVTNSTTIDDNTGDFSLTMPINTVPPGTYAVTYSYPGTNSTLAPAIDTSTALIITKAPLTVTATNQIKTYGQAIPAGTNQTAFTATGLQNGETIGFVTLTVSGSPIAGNLSNAPAFTYTITPSLATNGTFNITNYSVTYVAGTLTVNPFPVGLAGTNTYNGTAAAPFSVLVLTNKAVSTDVVNVASGSVTLASSAAGVEPIISGGTLALGGAQGTNYTSVGAIGSVTVNPLPIGLAGTNTYNGATTAAYNILSITNVVGSDDVSLASGSATLAAPAAGVEPITSASGLVLAGTTAGNYTTTGATGSVTVNPLPIGLTGTRQYDGTATAVFSILSITNIVGSDVVNLTAGSATLASSAVGVENITSASGLTLGGAQAGNYTTTGAVGAVTVTSNPNPTPIGFSVNNGALTLSWPADHTGWTLEAQTNGVSGGLSANWVPVSGSTTTNQMTFPIDPANGCVFYQLFYTP